MQNTTRFLDEVNDSQQAISPGEEFLVRGAVLGFQLGENLTMSSLIHVF